MRLFGHYVKRHVLLVGLTELAVVYLSLSLLLQLPPFRPEASSVLAFEPVAASAVFLLALLLAGHYEEDRLVTRHPGRCALQVFPVLVVAGGALLLYAMFVPASAFTVFYVGAGILTILLGLVVERTLWASLSSADAFKRKILVLGVGSRAREIEHVHPEKSPAALPYRLLGYIATPEEKDDTSASRLPTLRLEGDITLLEMARDQGAHEIVVAIRDRRGNLPIKQLLDCKLHGIRVMDLTAFFEREQQKLQLGSLNASWLVFGEGFRQDGLRQTVKRSFDVLASGLLLLVTLPVMLLTAIAIKLESRGPVFYWQTRVGLANEPFEVCKFRSMREDAEVDGVARWAAQDDDRITRVGRIIRKLRIDELPQVINVFQGTMSFVGPRPERPIFVRELSREIPYFEARHSLRPGITGWAQVRYPYGASVEDAREKLQYDLYYVKNHTLFLDIVILVETVKVVLFGRGAR
ncbi:TIGR03013 family XrtA/PEP-CTERM system glycosyltransferase [Thioalkalivibrio sp. ALJ24]|uniref:TIGR03013 family XrtA/PEP-CTERM system glycosyltransferase n=1 Tax=Thioalkalivibrio sp. ALJ24 TaxID=545276 RepID=UPI000372C8AF|nr:TIGR03013 family XrtA/PEP-CTERM system glycosyltransferase [Thioalkalivibrio sp. ALJ24]